jgi:hypothetical protein
VKLGAGATALRLRYTIDLLKPGGGGQIVVGPLLLVPQPDDGPLIEVPRGDARALCGRNLDWMEAVSA